MKREQEAAAAALQQKTDAAAAVGNHVGASNPPSHVVVQNHVPPHHAPAPPSKPLQARVGPGRSEPDSNNRSSAIASALAVAGVDSAVVGGGQAAAMASVRGGGDGETTRTTRTSKTTTESSSPPPSIVVEDRAPAGPTKLPASMTSPSTTAPRKKDNSSAAGRKGETPRFSQLLSPSVIDDHFDQYITARQPGTSSSSRPSAGGGSGSGDEFPAFSYDNRPHEPASSTRDGRSRAVQRRKTLPGRPPGPLLVGAASTSNPGHRAPAPTLSGDRENEAVSFVAAAAAATATAAYAVPVYRKSTAAAAAAPPPPPRPPAAGGGSAAAAARLRKAGGSNRGSMPDVSECASVTATAASASMPREEVHVLSLIRREELRRLREDAARRHQQDIVLRLGDIKVSG